MKNSDLFDMEGCIVRNSRGVPIAKLHEDGEYLVVTPLPACSIGTYFYVLYYFSELGFNVR